MQSELKAATEDDAMTMAKEGSEGKPILPPTVFDFYTEVNLETYFPLYL